MCGVHMHLVPLCPLLSISQYLSLASNAKHDYSHNSSLHQIEIGSPCTLTHNRTSPLSLSHANLFLSFQNLDISSFLHPRPKISLSLQGISISLPLLANRRFFTPLLLLVIHATRGGHPYPRDSSQTRMHQPLMTPILHSLKQHHSLGFP